MAFAYIGGGCGTLESLKTIAVVAQTQESVEQSSTPSPNETVETDALADISEIAKQLSTSFQGLVSYKQTIPMRSPIT